MLTAKDIMTEDVVSVSPDLAVEEFAALLLEKRISGAPVVGEDGKLMGVVTENDLIDQAKNVHIPTVVSILDSFLFLEKPSKLDEEIQKMAGRVVGDICTKKIRSVDETTSLSDIATIMAEKRIHTLPVVKDGNLVGVIGKSDIIRTIISNQE